MIFLGPVFRYDLIRFGRKGRYFLLRTLFALALLLLLYALYYGYSRDLRDMLDLQASMRVTQEQRQARLLGQQPGRLPQLRRDSDELTQALQARLSAFGEQFFALYMYVQFGLILLLTPGLLAGCIAEEKQRKTMDFLLTTELTRPEIVLGKLCSRLLLMCLLMLAGLPVLSMVQLFGGIDKELLQVGFIASFALLLSLASLSLCMSVFARSVRESLLKSYLIVLGYFIGGGILYVATVVMAMDAKQSGPLLEGLKSFSAAYDWGNPIAAIADLRDYAAKEGKLDTYHWVLLEKFLSFHLVVIVVSLTIATWRVRRIYVQQTYDRNQRQTTSQELPFESRRKEIPAAPGKKPFWLFRLRRRPPVSNWPMYWKERFCERTFRFGVLGRTILILSVIILVSPAVIFATANVLNMLAGHVHLAFGQSLVGYLRWTGMIFLQLLLLAVGVRAATGIALEKDRQTWESLLSTPIPVANILWAKWWHSLWSVRWLYLLLLVLWGCGLASLSLHWLALPVLLLNSLAAMLFASPLGLYCSVRFSTTLRAVMMTVAGLVLYSLAPAVLAKPPFAISQGPIWQHSMNLSPMRMVYVTTICPADDFDGWATFQDYTNRGTRGPKTFRAYPSTRQHREEVETYLGISIGLNLLPILFSCGFFLNAMFVLQKVCGRIDYAKTAAMRIQRPPSQYYRAIPQHQRQSRRP
jgi:ABC-type transport system involved in multi-copper enzyme maturation permease subunit